MVEVRNEVLVDRPIEEVFAYLSDGENNARWRGGILEVERTSDSGGQGATYRQIIQGPGGRRVRHDYRVVAYEPPVRLRFAHTAGLARPAGQFELTAVGPVRTAVSFELSWLPTGLKHVFNNMVERWMVGEVARLDELKRVLEET